MFDATGRQVSVVFDGVAKASTLNKVEFDDENYAWDLFIFDCFGWDE